MHTWGGLNSADRESLRLAQQGLRITFKVARELLITTVCLVLRHSPPFSSTRARRRPARRARRTPFSPRRIFGFYSAMSLSRPTSSWRLLWASSRTELATEMAEPSTVTVLTMYKGEFPASRAHFDAHAALLCAAVMRRPQLCVHYHATREPDLPADYSPHMPVLPVDPRQVPRDAVQHLRRVRLSVLDAEPLKQLRARRGRGAFEDETGRGGALALARHAYAGPSRCRAAASPCIHIFASFCPCLPCS